MLCPLEAQHYCSLHSSSIAVHPSIQRRDIPKDATGPWGLRFSVPGLHPLALAGLGLSVNALDADRSQSIIILNPVRYDLSYIYAFIDILIKINGNITVDVDAFDGIRARCPLT